MPGRVRHAYLAFRFGRRVVTPAAAGGLASCTGCIGRFSSTLCHLTSVLKLDPECTKKEREKDTILIKRASFFRLQKLAAIISKNGEKKNRIFPISHLAMKGDTELLLTGFVLGLFDIQKIPAVFLQGFFYTFFSLHKTIRLRK